MNKIMQGICTECTEAISDPICLDCFLNQMEDWMIDEDIDPQTKRILIKEIKKEFNEYENNPEFETICTICQRQEVSICSYCFFLKIVRILKKIKLSKKKVETFREIFNYRQWHEDY